MRTLSVASLCISLFSGCLTTTPPSPPLPPSPPSPSTPPASPTTASTPPASPRGAQSKASLPEATVTPPAKPAPSARPEAPPPITSVWLELYNNCPKATDYCVDDGNVLYTSLSSNTLTTHSARPGARIRYRKGNNCTETVYTVTDASEKQKANLCK
jgi:hypothetical protein